MVDEGQNMTLDRATRLTGRYLLLGFIAAVFVMPIVFMSLYEAAKTHWSATIVMLVSRRNFTF